MEAKIMTNPITIRPGASSSSAMKYKNGRLAVYKILIVNAQYLIIFKALTDNSEKALFLSI
ncbi:hypothetical protein D3C71_1673210 [compost metagenome]